MEARTAFGVIVGPSLTFPAPAHYDNNGFFDDPLVTAWRKGSFLEDGMWPWDGTDGWPARTRPAAREPGHLGRARTSRSACRRCR